MKISIQLMPKDIDKKVNNFMEAEIEKGREDLEKVCLKAIGIARASYLSGGSKAVLHEISGDLARSLRVLLEGDVLIYGAGKEAPYGKYHEQIKNNYPRMYKENIMPKRPFLIPSLRASLMGLKTDRRWREVMKQKLLEAVRK